jgi:hypothetical protein
MRVSQWCTICSKAANVLLAVLQAKKKGGGKKKQAGSLMNPPKPAAPYLQTEVIMHNLMMVESYKRKVGK